jgi:phosphohistidine phosphatase
MFERLYIVRHGEAMPHGTPGLDDDDRPLTAQGEERFAQAAQGLARIARRPDRIVTSPLPRARRTAELLAEAVGFALDRLEIEPALRADEPTSAIARWVVEQASSTTGSLAIVGHNPWCEELLGRLVTGAGDRTIAEFKKGAIAAVRPGVRPADCWSLEWLAHPKLLRKLRRGGDDD